MMSFARGASPSAHSVFRARRYASRPRSSLSSSETDNSASTASASWPAGSHDKACARRKYARGGGGPKKRLAKKKRGGGGAGWGGWGLGGADRPVVDLPATRRHLLPQGI